MAPRITAPQQRAEAPRIGVAQGQTGLQFDIHMLMLSRRQAHFDQTQTARHTQVADQTPGFSLDQQVLGTPLDTPDALPGQLDIQIFGNRPAQAPLAHDDTTDTLALKVGSDATAGGFYFGKFWHGRSSGEPKNGRSP